VFCKDEREEEKSANEAPAIENLVPYSVTHPHIFKKDQLTPVKHLKLLTRDYPVCGRICRA
jgi:hypothetical protein